MMSQITPKHMLENQILLKTTEIKQQGIMLSVERRYLYPQGSRSYRRGPSPRE